jgi:tRNA U34 2-thiouridine synthase MnmA/TrmU
MEHLKSRNIPDTQEEVIERYCAEARQLLEQATSREEALAIRERVCSQLSRECESALILDATQMYVDQVIHMTWNKRNEGDTPQ